MIAVQHPPIDDVIKRKSSLDLVSVSVADAAQINIRLDDETVAGLILIAQVLSDRDHSRAYLVTQDDRIRLQITMDAGMLLAGTNNLDVGET